MSWRREACHSSPANNSARVYVSVCVMSPSMHERILRVLILRGSFLCAHTVCEHDVCDLCVCVCVRVRTRAKETRRVNSQSGGPTFKARHGKKTNVQ